MKKKYILILMFFCNCLYMHAQTATEILIAYGLVHDIAIKGDFLYYIRQENLYRFDITDATPNPTYVSALDPNALFLEFKGDELYISNDFSTSISKLDVTQSSPALIQILDGIVNPLGMAFNGNDLYVGQHTGKILKVDVTSSTPTAVEIVSGIDLPSHLVLKDNFLYASHPTADKITKFDITATSPTAVDVVTGLSTPRGMVFKDNDLYFVQESPGRISKIDITETSPTPTDIATGIEFPTGITISGDVLYVSDLIYGRIYEFSLVPLSIEEVNAKNNVNVYPNPTNDFVQISGLTKKVNYQLFNMLGSQISNGTIAENEDIDMRNFPNSVYFLKLNNQNVIKIVKN